MSAILDVRKRLNELFPDYCSIELPWIDLGGGEAGELHRVALRMLRDHDRDMVPRSSPVRLARGAAAAVWPANGTLRSLAILVRLWRAAEREFGVGGLAQLAGLLWATHRHNIAPKAFYKYRLFLPGNRARVTQFFQEHEMGILTRLIRERYLRQAEQVDHKYAFWQFCVANGLPAIPVLAYGAPSGPPEWHVDELPPTDLILKRTNYSSGEGFECWLYDRERGGWSLGHQHLGPTALRSRFAAAMLEDGAIVQPRVSNHPALRSLAPHALSTVRMVTAVDRDGEPYVAGAAMRAGVGSALLDNFAQGGIGGRVDIESGQAAAEWVVDEIGAGWMRRHPDSGAILGEVAVPCWPEVRAACLRAHRCIGDLPTVGWDIAVTADGPTFVEANTLWSSELIQLGVPFPPRLLRTLHRALTL